MLKEELKKDDVHSKETNSVVFLICFLPFLRKASFSVASRKPGGYFM